MNFLRCICYGTVFFVTLMSGFSVVLWFARYAGVTP